ncbi:PAS fold [Alteribacillus iranensis]|uniref:PAS fold n=2 Tax=Alteribacillus iranensis TaxID=930128 RepID=A0A1I2B7I9_9BACI|nr:PAS fold [Alteribacillus iranensis]
MKYYSNEPFLIRVNVIWFTQERDKEGIEPFQIQCLYDWWENMGIDIIKGNKFVQKIFNVLNDGLYFSDRNGTTIWINDKSEEILSKKREELVGRNVRDLEKEGVMNPSITRLVLESGKPVTTVQSSTRNRQYLVSGHKIDLDGETLVIV